MALPVVKVLEYPLTLPYSKKNITFRPYTVGDEKLLLAAESARKDKPKFYVNNTMKVLRGVVGADADLLDTLTSIDVEYLLLQIRAKSVGEIVTIKVPKEDGKFAETEINLESFQMVEDPKHVHKIELTESIGLVMKDLTFADKINYMARFSGENQSDMIFETIVDCVVSIYDDDKVYVVGQHTTKEEVRQFIDSLAGVSHKLFEFIATMPQLSVDVKLPDGTTKAFTSNDIDFLVTSPGT